MLKKIFTPTILILSFVSLFTDISSEMLYPIMPIYLKSIGFSVLFIGILEGFAEAISGLSKGYFGKMSDTTGRRVPFVRLGYLLSSVSKPMMGLLIYPLWIFGARTIDRLGKGLRTSARDAMLSEDSTPQNKGKVFGFHRGMDTLGAAMGPVLALIYLSIYPENYRTLFFLAFIPAVIGVVLTFIVKDKNKKKPTGKIEKTKFFSFLAYWKTSTSTYKKLVIGLFAFTVMNSSDIFLLLMLKNMGYQDNLIIWVYIFYNLVYALSAFPIGILSDKIGFKNSFAFGLAVFAFVYACMSLNPGMEFIFFIFLCYGIYAASTEGVSKAWITNISDKKEVGTALGFYTGLSSIFSLVSSAFAGFLWYTFNPKVMFIFSSTGTILVLVYFLLTFRRDKEGC